jgi:hypothetical protein
MKQLRVNTEVLATYFNLNLLLKVVKENLHNNRFRKLFRKPLRSKQCLNWFFIPSYRYF